MRIASYIISALFHPILMPTLGLLLIFQTETHISNIPYQFKQIILIIVILTTVILPVSILPFLRQIKVIKSFRMESARERFIPLLITAVFYFFGYMLIKKIPIPAILDYFFLATLIGVLLASIISFFWKISIHLMGLGGVTGALVAVSLVYSVDLFPLITLTMSASALTAMARLFLGEHNPKQVYSGFLCGFLIVVGVILT